MYSGDQRLVEMALYLAINLHGRQTIQMDASARVLTGHKMTRSITTDYCKMLFTSIEIQANLVMATIH